MATVEVEHDPELEAAKLYQFLKEQLGEKYVLQQGPRRQTRRQVRIHGEQCVVIVKRNAFCGAFLLVKQSPNSTKVKIWKDGPSESVFRTFAVVPILLPLLIFVVPIIKIGSVPVVRDVRACLAKMQAPS